MHINRLSLPTRLAEQIRNTPKVVHPDGVTTSDYTRLYPVTAHTGAPADQFDIDHDLCDHVDDCDRCTTALSPRQAFLLHEAAIEFLTLLSDELEHLDHDGLCDDGFFVAGHLPAPVLRWLTQLPEDDAAHWLNRYLNTIDITAARVATGEVPTPRCTAEEMALHSIISFVDVINDLPDDCGLHQRCATFTATHPNRDTSFDLAGDTLFEDDDVLMLFDPAFDGIETSDLGETLGVANLHGRNWFDAFRDNTPTDRHGYPIPSGDPTIPLGDDPSADTLAGVAGFRLHDLDCAADVHVAPTAEQIDTGVWIVATSAPLTANRFLGIKMYRHDDHWHSGAFLVDTSTGDVFAVAHRDDLDPYWDPTRVAQHAA